MDQTIRSMTARQQIDRAPGGGVVTCGDCFYQWWVSRQDLPLGREEACDRPDCPVGKPRPDVDETPPKPGQIYEVRP